VTLRAFRSFCFILLFAASLSTVASAQGRESRIEHYTKHAHLVATFPLTFPGPEGGYTMAHIPVSEVTPYGDTVVIVHAFILDVGTANEGNYIPKDSNVVSTGYTSWNLMIGQGHLLHVALAPMNAHKEYRNLDSTYFGTLGYAFFKQFMTAIDYKKNTISLYTLYSSVNINDRDTQAIQMPYFDDAFLTYCHCPYPTIWLDAAAPPLKEGRVHLGLASARSSIYEPALDAQTKKQLSKAMKKDTLTGKVPPVGLSLASFKMMGYNIAPRSPHRWVEEQPAIFKDLSIFILGELGNDVLRTFSGIIIDPARTKFVLIK
jgi:hypothetical protein